MIFEQPHLDVCSSCGRLLCIRLDFSDIDVPLVVIFFQHQVPVLQLHPHELAVDIYLGQRVAVQPLELVQQLGLAGAVRQDQQRREGNVVRQRDRNRSGKPLIGALFVGFAQLVAGSLPVLRQELHGHSRYIGLGDSVGGKCSSIVFRPHPHQLHMIVRHQAVLGLQDLLHPAGEGADLAVHTGLHPVDAVLQIRVLIVHPAQAVEEMEQHQAQDQACRDKGPAAALPGLWLGGDVPARDLLHHAQLLFCQRGLCSGSFPRGLRKILHTQEPSHGDAVKAAQRDQLVDLRQSRIRFPFVNRLAGDPQLVPQRLLGERQFLSLLCDALPDGHSRRLLSPPA